MSDDFKRKLEAYEKGELSEAELEEFEIELDKLESYQEYLQEKTPVTKQNAIEQKQKKVLRRSKWKARAQTAFFAIGLFLVFTIVSSIITALYYSSGSPNRVDVFRDVIDYTMTVTDPYGDIGRTSTNGKVFFGMEASRNLNKVVGSERIKVGELRANFFFSMMSYPEREYYGDTYEKRPAFSYPGADRNMSSWKTLENLPEGTVVSAYVSFSELYDTKEVFQLFRGKDIDLLWLAVDTGKESKAGWNEGIIFEPIGFPQYPIWHDDDMILDSRVVEKGLLGSKVVSEGYSSPDYNPDDPTIIHQQFLKTLRFLEQHEKKVKNLSYIWDLSLNERIGFLEENGIYHYGVVITGPTKEVLALQSESWISALEIDEVRLWNWRDWN